MWFAKISRELYIVMLFIGVHSKQFDTDLTVYI